MRIMNWLRGWKETLVIKYREPELYRDLTAPLRGEDFEEVQPPAMTKEEIAAKVEENLSQREANLDRVEANRAKFTAMLEQVDSARWRIIRNHRLLKRCWELQKETVDLLAENARLRREGDELVMRHQP